MCVREELEASADGSARTAPASTGVSRDEARGLNCYGLGDNPCRFCRVFILEVDRKRGRTSRQSYQYVDVLTGMVELSQNGEPLFEPFVPESADGAPAADLMDEQEEEKVLS